MITRALSFGDIFSTKSPFYGSLEVLQKDGIASISMIRDGHNPELIGTWEFRPTGFTLPVALDFLFPSTRPSCARPCRSLLMMTSPNSNSG